MQKYKETNRGEILGTEHSLNISHVVKGEVTVFGQAQSSYPKTVCSIFFIFEYIRIFSNKNILLSKYSIDFRATHVFGYSFI